MHCPHCKEIGILNRHGSLFGFDDSSKSRVRRAYRVYCSNRNRRPGCGKTVSVWLADKVRRLSVTAGTLWHFLQCAVSTGLAAAYQASRFSRSERTWQRFWGRFDRAQSAIRTALLGRCPPPTLSPTPKRRPAEAHVLAHLILAFPEQPNNPIAAFQLSLQAFFI